MPNISAHHNSMVPYEIRNHSFFFKLFCMSQPYDAIRYFSSKKVAIQKQLWHTGFLANKEIYSSKYTIQALWQKQILEKTNYQERSQRIYVFLTYSRYICLWMERLRLEQYETKRLSNREVFLEFLHNSNDAIWNRWERKG